MKTNTRALAQDAAERLTAKLRIERIPIGDLIEPDKNPNQMGAEEFRLLIEAIKRVGFLQPVLARPEGGKLRIVDGVHRYRAAKEAGMTVVPAVVGAFDDDEAAALQIGMNRLRGELDLAKVAESMGELADLGWTRADLTLTGFSTEDVDELLRSLETEDPEDILTGASSEPDTSPEEKTFILEIPMSDVKALRSARRKLKKLGGGDLGAGLLSLLEEA